MKPWSHSIWTACRPVTSSASGSTPAMRFAATKSARTSRARGATVVFGGIHATLYPQEAQELGGAHAVVRGDGDVIWPRRPRRCAQRHAQAEATRVDVSMPTDSSRRGGTCCRRAGTCGARCRRSRMPEALFVLLGLAHRRPEAAAARRSTAWWPRSSSCGVRGFRFVALADDNFYPVTLADLAMAERQRNVARLEQLQELCEPSDSS